MPSRSISQSAVRSSPAVRHSRTGRVSPVQSQPSQTRRTETASAAHVGPGGLAQRRAQLEARWRNRLERITELSLAYYEEAERARSADAPGHGATSPQARLLGRRAVAERQALADIEAALDRIAAGRYGWCEQCGRPIAGALLTIQPQVRYCGACGRQSAQRLAFAS